MMWGAIETVVGNLDHHVFADMAGVLQHDRAAHDSSVEWLQSFDLSRVGACNIDDSDDRPDWRLAVTPKSVHINDVFSAGPKVPFHVRLSGPLDGAPEKTTDVQVCGVLTVGWAVQLTGSRPSSIASQPLLCAMPHSAIG